jgi:hypothetical protein
MSLAKLCFFGSMLMFRLLTEWLAMIPESGVLCQGFNPFWYAVQKLLC